MTCEGAETRQEKCLPVIMCRVEHTGSYRAGVEEEVESDSCNTHPHGIALVLKCIHVCKSLERGEHPAIVSYCCGVVLLLQQAHCPFGHLVHVLGSLRDAPGSSPPVVHTLCLSWC